MNKKILIIVCSIIALVVSISLTLILTNDKKVKTYNISFETNGGTTISEQIVKEGKKVVKPKDPSKKGYVFVQWLYGKETYDFSSKVNSDLILTAEWIKKEQEIETFIVEFNSDGGTTIPNQIVEIGNKVTVPATPTKEGYIFVEWQANGSKYDFEKIIESDLELVAKWQKIENKNDKPANNNNKKPADSGTNNNNSNNTSSVIKPSIPTLTQNGRGGSSESSSISYTISGVEAVDGIEVYISMNGEDYKLEKTLTIKELKQQSNSIKTIAYIGEHNYYKIRAYKTVSGKKNYSEYTKVVEITGPTLDVPTLSFAGAGASPEGSSTSYKITDIELADGIEIYKSTDGTNYKIEQTLNKTQLTQQNNDMFVEASLGEHNYYKVRAYKTVNGKKVYSEYSRVVEISCALDVPTLSFAGAGASPEGSSASYTVTDIEFVDGIEVYKSTDGSNYKLEHTLSKTQLSEQNNDIIVEAASGEYNYYKVRAYKTVNGKKVYSDYSRVVEISCAAG